MVSRPGRPVVGLRRPACPTCGPAAGRRRAGDPCAACAGRTERYGWTNVVLLALSDFEAKVDRSGGPDACHLWTAATNGYGYGRLGGELDEQYAHRIAWELAHGRPVPAGLHVDHQCHNRDVTCPGGLLCGHRRCANSRHLEAVTPLQNARRAAERRRRMAGQEPLPGLELMMDSPAR